MRQHNSSVQFETHFAIRNEDRWQRFNKSSQYGEISSSWKKTVEGIDH